MISSNTEHTDKDAQGGPYIPASHNTEEPSNIEIPINIDGAIDDKMSYLLDLEQIVHQLPLTQPIKRARVTSYYGKRLDPLRKSWAMHYGLDFAASLNSKVYSTGPGKIVKAGRNGAYGLLVEIDHGNGFRTRYGHLNKIYVKRGQMIERGKKIGLQGNSGRSTGSHLHYEVRYRNIPQNPLKYLKAGEYVF